MACALLLPAVRGPLERRVYKRRSLLVVQFLYIIYAVDACVILDDNTPGIHWCFRCLIYVYNSSHSGTALAFDPV